MRVTLKNSIKAALVSTALVIGFTAPAYAGESIRKIDMGYWSKVDLNTVVLYDWSMRLKYKVELTQDCHAMNEGHGAQLGTTHNGRINGSIRDRLIFEYKSCGIKSVERLTPKQFASLINGGEVQLASIEK